MKIFISYRREDSAPYSGRLRDALEARFGPGSVFFDVNSIEGGEPFTSAIVEAMALTDVVVVVIGRDWVTAARPGGVSPTGRRLDDSQDPVRIEIRTALDRRLDIIPVLVGGASMPSAEQLPDEIKPLTARNAIKLTDDRWSDDVQRIRSAIERLATRPTGFEYPQVAEAVNEIQRKNYAAAVDLLTRLLVDHPTAEAYYHRGLAYFFQNKFDQALTDFDQAVVLAPGWAMAYRQRGNALFQLRNCDRALADYDRAIQLEPREPRAYMNRAEIHLDAGDPAKAIADLKAVIKLHADAGLEQIAESKLLEIRARHHLS